MKKQKKYFGQIVKVVLVLLMSYQVKVLSAQSALSTTGVIPPNEGTYQDRLIPASMDGKYLQMVVRGADGGRSRRNSTWSDGGSGATVQLTAKIGTAAGEIKPGSTIRFMIGKSGANNTGGAPGTGGGGTGVAFNSGSKWVLLAVAGGGSGAFAGSGNGGQGITYTYPSLSTGHGGASSNSICSNVSSGGGGAFSNGQTSVVSQMGCSVTMYGGEAGWPMGPDSGEPTGGNGRFRGGWGFGGGGGALDYGNAKNTGAGGGYQGGNNNDKSAIAEGGYSFLHQDYATGLSMQNNPSSAHSDGYVEYAFISKHPQEFYSIKMAAAPDMAIDVQEGDIDLLNGANIQLNDATEETTNQKWYFYKNRIKLAKAQNKCLDLKDGNTNKGANIQLWDCSGISDWPNQLWLYDGIHQLLRSGKDPDKCIDVNGVIGTGNNLQLWNCNGTANQQWKIEGATTADLSSPAQAIQMAAHTDKCIDVDGVIGTSNNLQLWNCNSTANQQWTFDGLQIKLKTAPGKCLDLDHSGTANGTNIQLYDCNGTDAQQWVYDGLTRAFRSKINTDKCLDISGGNTTKGTNIQLWDCQPGNTNQQFVIDPLSCIEDSTPPVAKCKDVTYSGLTVPVATDLNNGSSDNCSISDMKLEYVSGNTYKLIVEDPSGNTSSCTATVTMGN